MSNTSSDIWIAGAFAAFTVDLLVYPLDTLKTRIQSPDYRRLYVHEASNTLRKAALFRALYQGVGSVILATLPSSGAFFTTYEHTKTLLSPLSTSSPIPIPAPLIHATASGLAELVSCAILTPAEVIKQNAQTVSAASIASTRSSATAQTLARFRANPFALWRGYGALAGRNLPFTAMQFPLFEWFQAGLRERWRRRTRRKAGTEGQDAAIGGVVGNAVEESMLEQALITALSAGTAGSIAAVLTTPIDVVKTRIMLAAATSFADQSSSTSSAALSAMKQGKLVDALGTATATSGDGGKRGGEVEKPAHKKLSSIQIAREIVGAQGWRGLWRGGALRGVWTMLGSGLYLGVYESGKTWLARRRKED